MDRGNHQGNYESPAGMMYKAASLAPQDVTEEELRAINRLTLEPLAAEDVFVFKAVLCDTELDRHYEHFTPKALHDMAKLFMGRTVIKDHIALADNQVARIYATEVVDTGRLMKNGEAYMQLVARCYMVRTASNADLIAEIRGGIKKEGSVGFRAASAICSICGTDNAKTYCRHWRGNTYDKEGGKTVCTFKLAGVSDAYEFSLVAVPAQRAAGASKSYGSETIYEADQVPEAEPIAAPGVDDKAKELTIRARLQAAVAKNHIDE